jgi:hypothetical protein
MSWSTNRKSENEVKIEKIRSNVRAVNGILSQLARDSDLQEDLSDSEVKLAMKHWTGEKRLPPEEAQRFQENYRVLATLGKIRKLQEACRELGVPVPLDHVISRKTELDSYVLGLLKIPEIEKLIKEENAKRIESAGQSAERKIDKKEVDAKLSTTDAKTSSASPSLNETSKKETFHIGPEDAAPNKTIPTTTATVNTSVSQSTAGATIEAAVNKEGAFSEVMGSFVMLLFSVVVAFLVYKFLSDYKYIQ